ncbi:MAG: hypothetical protein ACE5H3_12540 [Planctomycetota bacterium]
MAAIKERNVAHEFRTRVREFGIPPIHDALVVGRNSPIGCSALRRALDLLVSFPFEHIELEDEVIQNLLVRAAILKRAPREVLISYVLKEIKPLMGPEEVLHLDLEVSVLLGFGKG